MEKRNVCLISDDQDIIISIAPLLYKKFNLFIEHNILNFKNIIKKVHIDFLIIYPDNVSYIWSELALIQLKFPFVIFIGILDDNRVDIAYNFGQLKIKHILLKANIKQLPDMLDSLLLKKAQFIDFKMFDIDENKCSPIMRSFLRKIKTNYLTLNNITSIAKSIGVTNSYLSNEVKKYSSLSPKKILMLVKFVHIIPFMKSPGFKLKEISEIIGCKNSRRFNEFTKQLTGLSPSHCRRLCKNDEIEKLLTERYNITFDKTSN